MNTSQNARTAVSTSASVFVVVDVGAVVEDVDGVDVVDVVVLGRSVVET
jgi:hypothetical protein